jgi:hypothetical protein
VYADQTAKLCRLGATDVEIADFFGKDERTINRWKADHPESCQALNDGKLVSDMDVADRLHQRALGAFLAIRPFDQDQISPGLKSTKGLLLAVEAGNHRLHDALGIHLLQVDGMPRTWRIASLSVGIQVPFAKPKGRTVSEPEEVSSPRATSSHNGGRHQIGTVGEIIPEWWARSSGKSAHFGASAGASSRGSGHSGRQDRPRGVTPSFSRRPSRPRCVATQGAR